MKKLTVLLAGLGMATAVVPAIANAAPVQPVAERQADLNFRIDQGIRSGALSRPEAFRLKSELRNLANLEYRYRISGGGMDQRERADLQRRYDILSRQVRFDKHDMRRGFQPGDFRPDDQRPGGFHQSDYRPNDMRPDDFRR